MSEASPYLLQPAKPCPVYLPGDLVFTHEGAFRCRHTRWDGDGWVYLVAPLAPADRVLRVDWARQPPPGRPRAVRHV